MDEVELLRAVYRSVDWQRLYELAPQMDREAVDALFHRLGAALQAGPKCPAHETAAPGTLRKLCLYCDGASSGNPGPAAIGMVLQTTSGQEIVAWGEFIGKSTNNVAEYRSAIAGLKKALELGAEQVQLFSDSELLVRQLKGLYKVKSPQLKSLHAEVMELFSRFGRWQVEHIPRQHNRRADALAKEQIRAHAGHKNPRRTAPGH